MQTISNLIRKIFSLRDAKQKKEFSTTKDPDYGKEEYPQGEKTSENSNQAGANSNQAGANSNHDVFSDKKIRDNKISNKKKPLKEKLNLNNNQDETETSEIRRDPDMDNSFVGKAPGEHQESQEPRSIQSDGISGKETGKDRAGREAGALNEGTAESATVEEDASALEAGSIEKAGSAEEARKESGNAITETNSPESEEKRKMELRKAYEAGVIAGRNQKIEETFFPELKDDGIPHFHGMPSKAISTSDIFSIAREA